MDILKYQKRYIGYTITDTVYTIYDNIEDSCRHFEDNFRKSVISMSHMLYVNG